MAGELRSYERVLRLGHGGMAEVWLAVSRGPAGFRKLLVTKQLHAELAQDPTFVSMFLDEARLAAQLSHPNIVQTVEIGGRDAERSIVMEYLEGQTLGAIRRRAWLPLAMELSVCRDLLRALEYAHDLRGFSGAHLGIVHRDISPDNVFVTYDGVTKLMDFGVAKTASARTRSRVGMFKGKPMYMAPEQVRGEEVDRRADLFAIGVLLWEALCRRSLWGDANDLAILRELNRGTVPAVPEAIRAREPELSRICARAMSVDPAARYATAREFHDALADYAGRQCNFVDARIIGETVARTFSEERMKRRLTIEEELHKVRGRSTGEVALPPTRARDARPISKRGSVPASLRVPAKLTLRRRLVGESVVQYEAVSGTTGFPVLVELHDDVVFEDVQGRARSLCQAEHAGLQRMLDCGPTLGASGIYVVRERLPGRPLTALLSAGQPVQAADAVDLVAELARALMFVHGRGLAHGAVGAKSVFVLEHGDLTFVKLRGVPLFVDRNLTPADDVGQLFELLFQLVVGPGEPVSSAAIPKTIREVCPDLFELLYRGLNPHHPWRSAGAVLAELTRLRREELAVLEGGRRLPMALRSADLPRPVAASRDAVVVPEKPHIWVIDNVPAFRDPGVRNGLAAVERYGTVTHFDDAACQRVAQEARRGDLRIPAIVVFGDLDVLVGNPLLKALRDVPEVCRLVVSTHAHAEMLQETANEMGLHQQIALPCTPDDVTFAVVEVLERATRTRRTCDALREQLLALRRQAERSAVAMAQRPPEDASGAEHDGTSVAAYGVA